MINLYQSTHQGIQGVFHYHSNTPGPHMVISCLTHGGEVSGLRVIEYLLNEYDICSKLLSGSITCMISNIQAYDMFLRTKDMAQSRFIDENMNRCATLENIAHGKSSEAQRLSEISPILEKADYYIDIHSTSQSPKSMAIYTSKSGSFYRNIINADEHYQDFTLYQKGKPIIDICERNGGFGLGLETGREGDLDTHTHGIQNVLEVLQHLGMIDSIYPNNQVPKNNSNYSIIGSTMVEDSQTFILTKNYQHNEQVAAGTIIAHQNGNPIAVSQDCIIVMPSKVIIGGEEYCFLAKSNM